MSITCRRSFTYGSTRSSCRVVGARSAASGVMRFTPRNPSRSNSLARSSIARVTCVSAGPPSGGLYLKPPSSGGLCDGVTTTPSARRFLRPRLWARMAREMAGVGVKPSSRWITVVTPLAASTSSAVRCAGADSAWVSLPMYSGPSMPWLDRCSQIACVMARMCASLNEPRSEEPRWPLVPKATRCAGSPVSGAAS